MIFSTKNIFKTILVVGLCAHITGCMRHKPHDPAVESKIDFGDDADYDLAKAGGQIVPNQTQFENIRGWNIPLYQTFSFWADVRDNSSRNSLRDFPFEVLDEDGNPICEPNINPELEPKCIYKATADSQVVWRERIPYDHFKARAEPVRIVRKIKGMGARRGTRTVIFEVNPWANSRKNLIDVRHVTFELSENDAAPLKLPNYRSATKFRFVNPEDASELVIRTLNKQLFGAVEPILVSRYDAELDQLKTDYASDNLVFSKYEPTEFFKRRNNSTNAKILNQDLESLQPIERNGQRVYVYREKDNRYPNIDGMKFDFTVHMALGFRYPNLTDGFSISEISAGRFKVFAHLVLEPADGSQPVLLTPGINPIISEIKRNNDLQLNYKTIVPYYPSSGMVKLALKIIPMGVGQGLKPLDRLFTVGPYNTLVGKQGGLLEDANSRDDLFNFDDYVSSSKSGEKAYQDGTVDIAREFHLDDLSIRFATVEAGETAAQRTVIFKVETTVYDEVNGVTMGDNVPFEVVSLHTDYANPNDKTKWKFFKITNADHVNDPARSRRGKINWYDTITHKYYQTEELVERNIFIAKWKPGLDLKKKIEEWSNSYDGIPDEKTLPQGIQKLKIYMNPWDEKFGTFGQDARIASESFLEKVRGREKIPPRFFIGDFGYETLRFRYKIDKDMQLNVKKTVLLNLTPRVLRYSSILEGINSIYSLRDGIYLMKTAIQKDYLDPAARNEADLYQIPYKLEEHASNLPTQEYVPTGLENTPGIEVNGKNGDSHVNYNGSRVTDAFNADGSVNPDAYSIPYADPRRKRAMSMVKKLVRVNSGRVITPVEFSIEDLRLMRIRQQFFVQLELVNQVRLQLVNLVTKRFESIFQLKLGKNSPILDKMSPEEQEKFKELMRKTLDAVAVAVSDDVYVTEIEDIQRIIDSPEVKNAFQEFESAQFNGQSIDLRLRDILLQIKTEKEANTIHITDQDIENVIDQRTSDEERRKKEFEDERQAIEEMREIGRVNNDKKTIQEKQCSNLSPVEVYLDETKKTVSSSDRIDAVTKSLIPFDTGVYEEDYSETVSKFQPFNTDEKQFFDNMTNKKTLNQILTNDFTIMPAFSAVSNLDMLVDKKSGIKGRTFVGPMTFLYNTNRGSLRPTDNLDEAYCETDDCNSLNTSLDSQYGEIQNFAYEKSPFHGSIAHFQNVTFNDHEIVDPKTGLVTKIKGLETMFNEIQKSKLAYRRVEGFLTRFLDYFDMSYVSLTNEPIDRLICREDIATNKCIVKDTEKTILVEDFISQYSQSVNEIVNQDYKPEEKIELKFQNVMRYPYMDQRLEHLSYDHRITDLSLPWGFVSPKYNKDMYRCDLNDSRLDAVCSETNQTTKLGFIKKYGTEVAFVEPTKKELDDIIRYPFKGHEMVPSGAAVFDPATQSKMCDLLVYGEIARKAKALVQTEKDKETLRKDLFSMAQACQKDIQNELNPVVIERKFRIFDTGRYYFLGGKSMNINASRDVKINSGLKTSRTFSARPIRIITGIIERGKNFISVATSLVTGSFDFSYSLIRDKNFGEGTGITSGTYLVMQNAEFEVELTKYEQCLSIRWSPDFIDKYKGAINFIDGQFSEFYVLGLYLCSGLVENTPIAVNEKYYYFTQHFTEGDMLDPADIHNHPWLLALRGVREFSAFMISLQSFEVSGKQSNPEYEPEFVYAEEMIGYMDMVKSDIENVKKRINGDPNPTKHYAVTKREEWPIHQLVNTYKRALPTFPGVYTQLDEPDYYDRTWPWSNGGDPGAVMSEASKECPR